MISALSHGIDYADVCVLNDLHRQFLLPWTIRTDGRDVRAWLYPVGRNQRSGRRCCRDNQIRLPDQRFQFRNRDDIKSRLAHRRHVRIGARSYVIPDHHPPAVRYLAKMLQLQLGLNTHAQDSDGFDPFWAQIFCRDRAGTRRSHVG